MPDIAKGICWGGAIILLATGNYLGLIDDRTAQTMFIILPGLAVATINGSCFTRRQARRG